MIHKPPQGERSASSRNIVRRMSEKTGWRLKQCLCTGFVPTNVRPNLQTMWRTIYDRISNSEKIPGITVPSVHTHTNHICAPMHVRPASGRRHIRTVAGVTSGLSLAPALTMKSAGVSQTVWRADCSLWGFGAQGICGVIPNQGSSTFDSATFSDFLFFAGQVKAAC